MNWFEGHGETTPQQLLELRKALEFGAPTPATGGEGFGWPLVPQSIEATLAIATIQAKQIRFYRAIPKPDELLKSALHEFTRQIEIGYELEPFVGEGVIPAEHASRYQRDYVRAKYMATLRRITDPMAVVATVGGADALARESLNGTLHLLAQLEKALFWGDESANPLSFDGVFATIAKKFPDNIFDLRGEPLTPDFAQELTAIMINGPRYAFPEAFWLAPSAHVSLAKQSSPNLIYLADPTNPQMYTPAQGVLPRGFIGAHNQFVTYEPSIFLEPDRLTQSAAIGTAPEQTFTVSITVGAPGPNEVSLFTAKDAGKYKYAVAAYGAKGRSQTFVQAPVDVAAGQKVTITITRQAPVVNDIIYYQIWRSQPNGDKLYSIGKVAYVNGNTTTFVDLNETIAGCSWGVLLEYDPTVVQFRRLLPLLRIPFAKIDLSVRFAIVMFGMPVFETPTKIAIVKNIGAAE